MTNINIAAETADEPSQPSSIQESRPPLPSRNVSQEWLLALTSLGFFMAMMDSMIVTTASGAIGRQFGLDVVRLQWVLNAYNITIAALLLLGVAIGDRIGRRRTYILALGLFTLGSIACALSGSFAWLLAGRIVQGVGACAMTPMSMTILTSATPASKRGSALGIWSGVGGLALVVGPALGGLITASLSWQWIFWINVPTGLAGMILAHYKLPESRVPASRIDPFDAVLVVAASGLAVWALSEAPNAAMRLPAGVAGLAGVLAAVAFVARQRGKEHPLVPLRLFSSKALSGGVAATFLLYAAMYGVVFFLPQYLHAALGLGTLGAGLGLLWTGAFAVLSPFAGRLVDRYGERNMALAGMTMQVVGYASLAAAVPFGGWYWLLAVLLVLSGAGLALAGPALQKGVLGSVEPMLMGKASGVFNMFRQLGGAVGTALSVIAFRLAAGTFAAGFSSVLALSAILSALGLLAALLLNRSH
ncbi:MAG: DHA2 family efflux MFS transporter permease subunit [Bifidobacterium sp.]|uniref:DHA2 family efflux MFS transporter permease subunit n=1 Tax=Bifidobacterium sp. TaxID=41200 RepID=UPI0039E962E6